MIDLKREDEVELLRENNILVSKTLALVGEHIKPGVTTAELDKIAEEYIRANGATPSFLGYGGFPASLCISVNEQVVHGIPSGLIIKDGDIVSVDCGVYKNGFHGDSAYTFAVGEIGEKKRKLLEVTKESLIRGAAEAVVGKRTGDIAYAVQSYCEAHGFSVVRELVGHGLGRNLHESPEVPNYGSRGRGTTLKKGMVICIEPMINMGKKGVVFESDGWTVRTQDRQPSAHFEFAVAVGVGKPDILTTFEFIEQKIKVNG